MQKLQADLLVAGGGPAGVPCAVAAAREGAKVILVHDRPMLGGNASSEVRMHIVGADAFGGRPLEVEAREGGILEEFRLRQCVENPQRSATLLDLGLYNLVRSEPNITLLLNTALVSAESDGTRIHSARAVRHSTEETFEIRAGAYIDCTGDGRLALEAGAAFFHGREDRAFAGEEHARPQADQKTLGSTLLYQARRHDRPMPYTPPPWARTFTAEELRLRLRIDEPDHEDGLEYGFWWAEWGGELNTIADNETIRDELLAILFGIWDFIKNSGRFPHAANWALDWFGWLPGKRESRRFIGRHILTESDVLQARVHADTIAYGGWPIDLHPPAGVDAPDEPPCRHINVPSLYGIPLRCCMARDIDNLFFAGRNFSATHVAFASTRVMGTCAAVGQGLGTAVALAVQENLSPEALIAAVPRVQQTLLRNDAFLPGVPHCGQDDLAPLAQITADSEQPDAPATAVCSGYTRATHGPGGSAPGQTVPGLHRWISRALPATLELSWDHPVTARAVQLIFDTGLHRILTLSHSDKFTGRMIWGRPQPETVKTYALDVFRDGNWEEIHQTDRNFLRRNLITIPPGCSFTRLRVRVLETNGDPQARICEVRVLP